MGRKLKPPEQRMAFFNARASGVSLWQAAAAAEVSSATACNWLKQSGGVRPRVKKPRLSLRLSLDEREVISRGLSAGSTLTQIAEQLERSVPTVSREVSRNSGVDGYRAVRADRLAVARTARPRPGKLAADDRLRQHVEDKLRLCWSPQQISRRLARDYPHDDVMRVSHETIYTSLFVQTRPGLRADLCGKLRTRRVRRHPKRRVAFSAKWSRIPDLVPVAERPVEANDRLTAGHWEGDLIVGRCGKSHIVTLVERHSRALIALPLPLGATSEAVVAALIKAFDALPAGMCRSLTWDRGSEMVRHAKFTAATGIPVFFCDAYSPGSAAATRTRTGSYASTSRRRPISASRTPRGLPRSSQSSTSAHDEL